MLNECSQRNINHSSLDQLQLLFRNFKLFSEIFRFYSEIFGFYKEIFRFVSEILSFFQKFLDFIQKFSDFIEKFLDCIQKFSDFIQKFLDFIQKFSDFIFFWNLTKNEIAISASVEKKNETKFSKTNNYIVFVKTKHNVLKMLKKSLTKNVKNSCSP